MPKTAKALFLDRDGTINEERNYLYKTSEFKFIDSTVELCKLAQDKGFLLIVITNQSGVERGFYTIEDMNNCNDYMVKEFAKKGIKITDVFCCPYLSDSNPDRKPNPGLFLKAIDKYNIDVNKSYSYGDKERDIEAAKAAGLDNNYLITQFDVLKNKLINENN